MVCEGDTGMVREEKVEGKIKEQTKAGRGLKQKKINIITTQPKKTFNLKKALRREKSIIKDH